MKNYSTFRLEIGEQVDYGVLRIVVLMVGCTSQMGVDY